MGENWTGRMQIDLLMIIAFEMLKIVEVAGYIAVMSEEPYKTLHNFYIAENLSKYYHFQHREPNKT